MPPLEPLALFAWLLTLHATAAGRVYAAYGGVYIGVALAWLWAVDGIRPTAWDVAGVLVALDTFNRMDAPPPAIGTQTEVSLSARDLIVLGG